MTELTSLELYNFVSNITLGTKQIETTKLIEKERNKFFAEDIKTDGV